MAVIFGENALSDTTIEELALHMEEGKKRFVWGSNFTLWQPKLTIGAGVVLAHKLFDTWTDRIFAELIARGKLPYNPKNQSAMYYIWHPGSSITWHPDYPDLNSMTIYLSRDWEPNWGGYFCWKEWDETTPKQKERPSVVEARMRLPVYNNYVYMTDAEWHTTTLTAPCSPPRLTLQMFFSKD